MAFGRGFPDAIELDPEKVQDLIRAKENAEIVYGQITAYIAEIQKCVFHCLVTQNTSFREYLVTVLLPLYPEVTHANLDTYLVSENVDIQLKICELFEVYKNMQLQLSPEITSTFYRKEMMKELLKSGRITIKGMRQELQRLLDPDYEFAYRSQPSVDKELYSQLFKELLDAFGKPVK